MNEFVGIVGTEREREGRRRGWDSRGGEVDGKGRRRRRYAEEGDGLKLG